MGIDDFSLEAIGVDNFVVGVVGFMDDDGFNRKDQRDCEERSGKDL